MNQPKLLFILYHSEMCGHCIEMKPEWHKLENNPPTNIEIKNIESQEIPNHSFLPEEPSILGYPTMRLYHNGKLVHEYSGDRTYPAMKSFIENYKKQKNITDNNIVVIKSKKKNNIPASLVNSIKINRNSRKRKRNSNSRSPNAKKGSKKGSKKGKKGSKKRGKKGKNSSFNSSNRNKGKKRKSSKKRK